MGQFFILNKHKMSKKKLKFTLTISSLISTRDILYYTQ
jgi:hypothetical protein